MHVTSKATDLPVMIKITQISYSVYFIENNKLGTNKSYGFIIFLLGNKLYNQLKKNTTRMHYTRFIRS